MVVGSSPRTMTLLALTEDLTSFPVPGIFIILFNRSQVQIEIYRQLRNAESGKNGILHKRQHLFFFSNIKCSALKTSMNNIIQIKQESIGIYMYKHTYYNN